MYFELLSVNTRGELRFVFFPNTRFGRTMNGSNWFLPGHDIGEATADRVIVTKAKTTIILKVNLKLGEKNDRSIFWAPK